MRKIGIIGAAVCAFVLCFALAGCGGSGSASSAAASGSAKSASTSAASVSTSASAASQSASAASASANAASASASAAAPSATAAAADSKFTGDWRMLDGVVNGTSYTASDLQTANNMGMGVTLSLKADGTMNLEGGGDTLAKGTWTEADGVANCDGGDFGTFELKIDSTGIMTMSFNGEESHFSKK